MAVSFQQQGSLDWMSLGANSAHASIQLLSRISAAGIDPYTVLVGQAVCGSLLCGSEGRRRFMNALKACNGLAGYRNMLWFGFGVKHIATALVSTDQGTTCAALCACLAECYSTDFAAEILMEMTTASKKANEAIPSLFQWHQLVKSCAGLVTNSTFGLQAEQMMRLVGEFRTASPMCREGPASYTADRGVAYKREIAKTLLGLAKLSRGSLHQMTIIGGADAGFIAAVADWLLDMRVEIRGWEDKNLEWESEWEGTVFRSKKCGPSQEPQLLVIFEKDASENNVHCVGQTYHLPDAHQVIRRDDGSRQAVSLSGRVPWERALEYTFHRDFKRLMKVGQAFGSAIGSGARIYRALFEADNGLPQEWLRDCRSYFSGSHGTNYIQFTLSQFPELEPLRDAMFLAVRVPTVFEAGSNFEAQMKYIASECECQECCLEDDERTPPKGAFCLVYLTYTIMKISRALSGIVTDILPMRAGLEKMYWNLPRNRSFPLAAQVNIIELGEDSWHSGSGTKVFLQLADTIFSADRIRRFRNFRDWTCAVADNGLCYLFDVLVDPSYDAGRAARVHVVAGRIEHQERAYDLLSDTDSGRPPFSGSEPSKASRGNQIDALRRGYGGQVEVLLEERLDGLSIRFGLGTDFATSHAFGPARAVHAMCRYEGRLSPCHGTCSSVPQFKTFRSAIIKSIMNDEAFCRIGVDDVDFLFVLGDDLTRLVAVAQAWDPVIQRTQCLSCCITSGINISSKAITIIMGRAYCMALKMRYEEDAKVGASSGTDELTLQYD